MQYRKALLALTTALAVGGAVPAAIAEPAGTPDPTVRLERAGVEIGSDRPGPVTEIVDDIIEEPPVFFDPDGRICVRFYWYVMTDPMDGDEQFKSCPLILVNSA